MEGKGSQGNWGHHQPPFSNLHSEPNPCHLSCAFPVDIKPSLRGSQKGSQKDQQKGGCKGNIDGKSVFRKSFRITRKASSKAKELKRVATSPLQEQSCLFPLPSLTDCAIIWIFSQLPAAPDVTELYCSRTTLHPNYSKEVSLLQ